MGKEKVVLSTRVEPEYIRKFDEVAKTRKISRSSLLRDFAIHASDFYDFVVVKKERQQSKKIRLNENLTQHILDEYPEMPAEILRLVSDALKHAAEVKEAEASVP